jgi:hypothetical protein
VDWQNRCNPKNLINAFRKDSQRLKVSSRKIDLLGAAASTCTVRGLGFDLPAARDTAKIEELKNLSRIAVDALSPPDDCLALSHLRCCKLSFG